MAEKALYPSFTNPYLIEPDRPAPDEVAVIGAGHIGPDIAYYLRTGLPDRKLYLVDIAEAQLGKARERFKSYTEKAVQKKKMTPENAEKILGNVVYTTDYNDIKNCGLVIEAATENLELKRKVFHMLEEIMSKDAILTSNTSGIPANEIFSGMKHPERATITHFFAPAWRSLPVEVINWDGASSETLDYLLWFFANTGKVPMMTANVFSFLLNRIFETWCSEAAFLINSATSQQVDHVAEEFVASGPFFVMNFTGGNPLIFISQNRRTGESACYKPSLSLLSVDTWRVNKPGTKVDVPDDLKKWIKVRLLGAIFSQCFDITDSSIGTRSDLNLGTVIGLGFKKGIFEIMADMGSKAVKDIMEAFTAERAGFPVPKHDIDTYINFPRDILVDDINDIRVITIRRPQAANTLCESTCDEILSELKRGEKDSSIKGIIITGYGTKAFCAGADISVLLPTIGNAEAGSALSRKYGSIVEYINQMNKPVVAAVNGFAVGGGCELAMGCHSIVADENAFFQLPEITLGIFPGMGGVVIPYRKWPATNGKFNAMSSQAERLSSYDAEKLGIVTKITDGYMNMIRAAIEEVSRLTGQIPRIPDKIAEIPEFNPPAEPKSGDILLSKEAVGIIADVIRDAARAQSFKEAMEISYAYSGKISCLGAIKEGVSAFMEKRKPVFTR
ncbi:MAG: 3-hydroxyacyl-CoA dehydrogenase/enoyl-CoA hydratase family protein [Deltaproteobacteria bacterium]|nr:3-hydroxyacyl-CoA dehydrogenase/enoyl-CoA hydratase family protein [Deltaproteobacteria bacterium]